MATPSTVITAGLGSFGTPALVLTAGLGPFGGSGPAHTAGPATILKAHRVKTVFKAERGGEV